MAMLNNRRVYVRCAQRMSFRAVPTAEVHLLAGEVSSVRAEVGWQLTVPKGYGIYHGDWEIV